MSATTELTTPAPQRAAAIPYSNDTGMIASNFDEAWRMAQMFARSELVPKDYREKPENCLVAMQMGAEVGLKPLQALQGIAVVNGRPSIWGDALWALVQNSPLVEDAREVFDHENLIATCIIKRRGRSAPSIVTFTVDDAKKAGLWNKQGPWQTAPKRMLQMRARAFCARDAVPDVLKGLAIGEEAMDIDTHIEKDMGAIDSALTAFNARVATPKQIDRPGAPVKGKADTVDVMPDPKAEDTPALTFAQVADALNKATSRDTLDIAADMIGSVADQGQRGELSALYQKLRGQQ